MSASGKVQVSTSIPELLSRVCSDGGDGAWGCSQAGVEVVQALTEIGIRDCGQLAAYIKTAGNERELARLFKRCNFPTFKGFRVRMAVKALDISSSPPQPVARKDLPPETKSEEKKKEDGASGTKANSEAAPQPRPRAMKKVGLITKRLAMSLSGSYVVAVPEGCPEYKRGIRAGWRVLKVNGVPAGEGESARRLIEERIASGSVVGIEFDAEPGPPQLGAASTPAQGTEEKPTQNKEVKAKKAAGDGNAFKPPPNTFIPIKNIDVDGKAAQKVYGGGQATNRRRLLTLVDDWSKRVIDWALEDGKRSRPDAAKRLEAKMRSWTKAIGPNPDSPAAIFLLLRDISVGDYEQTEGIYKAMRDIGIKDEHGDGLAVLARKDSRVRVSKVRNDGTGLIYKPARGWIDLRMVKKVVEGDEKEDDEGGDENDDDDGLDRHSRVICELEAGSPALEAVAMFHVLTEAVLRPENRKNVRRLLERPVLQVCQEKLDRLIHRCPAVGLGVIGDLLRLIKLGAEAAEKNVEDLKGTVLGLATSLGKACAAAMICVPKTELETDPKLAWWLGSGILDGGIRFSANVARKDLGPTWRGLAASETAEQEELQQRGEGKDGKKEMAFLEAVKSGSPAASKLLKNIQMINQFNKIRRNMGGSEAESATMHVFAAMLKHTGLTATAQALNEAKLNRARARKLRGGAMNTLFGYAKGCVTNVTIKLFNEEQSEAGSDRPETKRWGTTAAFCARTRRSAEFLLGLPATLQWKHASDAFDEMSVQKAFKDTLPPDQLSTLLPSGSGWGADGSESPGPSRSPSPSNSHSPSASPGGDGKSSRSRRWRGARESAPSPPFERRRPRSVDRSVGRSVGISFDLGRRRGRGRALQQRSRRQGARIQLVSSIEDASCWHVERIIQILN